MHDLQQFPVDLLRIGSTGSDRSRTIASWCFPKMYDPGKVAKEGKTLLLFAGVQSLS